MYVGGRNLEMLHILFASQRGGILYAVKADSECLASAWQEMRWRWLEDISFALTSSWVDSSCRVACF